MACGRAMSWDWPEHETYYLNLALLVFFLCLRALWALQIASAGAWDLRWRCRDAFVSTDQGAGLATSQAWRSWPVAKFFSTMRRAVNLLETKMAGLATNWFWYMSSALFLDTWELQAVLAAAAGAAFLDGRLLLFGEWVGEAKSLLEMPLGVMAIGSSSSSGMEIRMVAGVRAATGAGP
jgi:hypothetical protein